MKAKRILSAAMAVMMVMGMVSCGSSDSFSAKSDNAAENGVKAGSPGGDLEMAAPAGDKTEAAGEAEGEAAGDDYTAAAEGEYYDGDTADYDMVYGDAADETAEAAAAEGFAADKAIDGEDYAAGLDIAPKQTNEADLPDAKQLTAGEWNDNDNWGFFANLVNSGAISFPSYNIDPRDRVAVTVKGDDGEPIANAKVRLVGEGGGSLWSAVTDRKGRAYLFSYGSAANGVEVEFGGEKQSFEVNVKAAAGSGEQGSEQISDNSQELTFKGRNGDKGSSDAQIMFIVDTTSSMSDEMLFLQSEFSSIVKDIGTDGVEYAVNFYRDEGDEYVTKCMDFSGDVDLLQKTIANEYAAGGGDMPEAVGAIMEESLTNGSWREDCVKIAFMIFDAPPHTEDSEQVETAVRAAAEKGIKLIPVVSSNCERNTELFGRALAITTGGSYVFLTDDSGIGDSHLEPIIGEYEVEKLYDIIIRLINDYRA